MISGYSARILAVSVRSLTGGFSCDDCQHTTRRQLLDRLLWIDHAQTHVGPVQRTALQEDIPGHGQGPGRFLSPAPGLSTGRVFSMQSHSLRYSPGRNSRGQEGRGPFLSCWKNVHLGLHHQGYGCCLTELQPYIDMFRELYRQADYHIQAVPICSPCRATVAV